MSSYTKIENISMKPLFPSSSAPRRAPFDLDTCIEMLLQKQLLGEDLVREICLKTKELLMRESNVVHISAPVTVVGDIHGYGVIL